ncbi:ferredoxin [Streptantibioticus parmotrematis]|uniref:ferredoxin n=1 Tax=Streptantibioticus parmotrematis TaxID=2873249 RepID=UPI0033C706F0
MSWEVRVDRTRCMGSGMCAAIAPDALTLDGAHARPVAEETAPDENVLDAADVCPAQAITVRADGEVVGPRPD